ncbi:MAG TPA: beta-N-acetylhexosaminidase, partial [Sphingobacterium sp.]|nr:beta-N-acetylhexosaminidase [Sphingobacterium sp.]
ANAGHDVIMTPGSHLYFDSYQTDPRTQPEAIGGYLTLDKVYSYDPIPAAIQGDKAKHILGAQANIWTEYVPTTEHLEYMVFPRALALAEVNWTNKDGKSWTDFRRRLQSHYKLL